MWHELSVRTALALYQVIGSVMHLKLVISILLLMPTVSLGAACTAPDFIEKTFTEVKLDQKTFYTNVAGILKISIPVGFEGIAFSGDANVFGYPNGVRIVIGLETPASIAPHKRGVKPEPFFRNVFTGKTKTGCKYLNDFNLEREDYRVRSKVGSLDIFAYGKTSVHEIFILNASKPDTVIRMRFNGYDRHIVESLLSTIKPQ